MRQNLSTFLGFGVATLVIWLGVIGHSTNPAIFLDSHALILVLGGTCAAGLIAFPFRRFKELGKFIFMVVLYPTKTAKLKVAEQILKMAGVVSGHIESLELRDAHHPLLVEGYHLIRKGKLTHAEFRQVLLQRNQSVKEHYLNDAKMLNAMAKFPPAFGLLGATTGMIAMMSNLGAAGQDSIGPAMAIALVATFWGIAVANLLLLPLADHASRAAHDQSQVRAMMLAGLVMVHQRASIAMTFELMRGFLPLDQRDDPTLLQLREALEAPPPRNADITATEVVNIAEHKNNRIIRAQR